MLKSTESMGIAAPNVFAIASTLLAPFQMIRKKAELHRLNKMDSGPMLAITGPSPCLLHLPNNGTYLLSYHRPLSTNFCSLHYITP